MGWFKRKNQEGTVRIRTHNVQSKPIPAELVSKLRASILFLGPLLSRFGVAEMAYPGGCTLGKRSVEAHLITLQQLGAEDMSTESVLHLQGDLKAGRVILPEFSVTATENILLLASLHPGTITIKTADQDYPIQELIIFLKRMGVKIRTSGLHVIEIEGAAKLKGASHTLMYDPIEAGTFIAMAAATKGDILVKNVEAQFLELFLKKLKGFGVPLEILSKKKNGLADVRVSPWSQLKMDKIQSFIYPGIHSDLQSVLGVLATQAHGSTLLHDPLYEGRLKYLEELNKMGAEIYFTDPHRAIINGPTKLFGADLGTFDLRGGAAVLIAALLAKGKSTINNIYQVDRGYERIEERLQKLGAEVKRVTQEHTS